MTNIVRRLVTHSLVICIQWEPYRNMISRVRLTPERTTNKNIRVMLASCQHKICLYVPLFFLKVFNILMSLNLQFILQ